MNFMVHCVAKGNGVNSLQLMDFHGAIEVAAVSKSHAFYDCDGYTKMTVLLTIYTALHPYMHGSPGASTALFSLSFYLSVNTHTHKNNIYREAGSKGRDMKAYHSYIGEVYTCQLSCNQNQQHNTYSEWLTRV